jgi:molybdate transport system regulatory protein
MSYRQAWQLVENMNQHAHEPLVEKLLGGKGGGGAKLTAAGQRAIKTFYTMEKKINDFINKESVKIKF